MYFKNEVLIIKGTHRIAYNGILLKPTWAHRGPAVTALHMLEEDKAIVTGDGGIQWREAYSIEHVCETMIHDVANALQAVIGFIDLGQPARAKEVANQATKLLNDLRVRLTSKIQNPPPA